MVYRVNIMLFIEIGMYSWRLSQFDQEIKKAWLEYDADLVNEIREVAHIWEFFAKHRASRRYNSKSRPMEMWESSLLLKQVVMPEQ